MKGSTIRILIVAAWVAAAVQFEKATGFDAMRWTGYALLAIGLVLIVNHFLPGRKVEKGQYAGIFFASVGLIVTVSALRHGF